MAELSIPAPYEPQKSDIHDRSARPRRPSTSRMDYVKRYWGFGLGILFACLITAMAFQARAGWDNHREWVVATTGPFQAIGGIAFGHIIFRRAWKEMAPGLLFFFLACLFIGGDVLADATNASDAARDTLSILGGIALGIAVACFIVGALWVELRRPTKAPAPEM
ncbi:MAG TPA: hypothetical protein PJ994_00865 [Tepidiformaceae bacterium]|nr:hypothetical protein [Tepidiformaceae bacterium]HMO96747.1 hypothetical protein [Tepidiformaceae bacterium]